MNPLSSLPEQKQLLVTRWVVPLIILFNIVGWMGLPQREANRSATKPTPEQLAAFGRALWAAWLVGMLVALLGLCAVFRFGPQLLVGSGSLSFWPVAGAGVVGGVMGLARGMLPRLWKFLDSKPETSSWKKLPGSKPETRRLILSGLVICAVAVSVTCAVLYYNSGLLMRGMIASAYGWMLVGYAFVHIFEVPK